MKNNSFCLLLLSLIAFYPCLGKIVERHRGLEEKSAAGGTRTLVQRRLPNECDYGGKKGTDSSGKKGGASCIIPSCCECDCYDDNYGGKKGGRGQVCDCVCDCEGDDDDDDDDDDTPSTPSPVSPTPSPVSPTPSPTRPPTPPPVCNVCGNDRSVANPFEDVDVSGFGRITCKELEDLGLNREISVSDCRRIPDQINGDCGCNPPCNVCGNGRPVGRPNAIVVFPGIEPMRCGELQEVGLAGSITESQCRDIPDFIRDVCECDPPRPTPNPTRNPTRAPIPVRTPVPTPSPTRHPPCDVCGNGRPVNNPSAVVELPGYGLISCQDIQREGLNRQISPSNPSAVMELPGYGLISCEDIQREGLNRQISPSECRRIPSQINAVCGCNPPCNICGNGKPVGRPNAIVRIPGLSPVRCEELQEYGLEGSITPFECREIPDFVNDVCECEPSRPTPSPIPNPTPAPTRAPTCVRVGKKGGKGGKKGYNGCDPIGYGKKGGKKTGYFSGDGLGYGGKKGGYGGKKSGYGGVYDDEGSYDDDDDDDDADSNYAVIYSGKKGGYGGKKAGSYGGKKGGYGGKKGGYSFPVVAPVSDDDDGDDDDDDNDDGEEDDDDDNDDDDDDDDDFSIVPQYCIIPNFDCYRGGRPECCFLSNNYKSCPYNDFNGFIAPPCDMSDDDEDDDDDDDDDGLVPLYCNIRDDFSCYEFGRPSCCFERYFENCPPNPPQCENKGDDDDDDNDDNDDDDDDADPTLPPFTPPTPSPVSPTPFPTNPRTNPPTRQPTSPPTQAPVSANGDDDDDDDEDDDDDGNDDDDDDDGGDDEDNDDDDDDDGDDDNNDGND
eukprot:CAMPEP_0194193772 /NCGR_PEP_ID=MMETSP0154-20130528/75221_1 /TAXON_ID=1049557 /ORGANISM="Thalassiothrix antarctica, Strain L6-D1" /LENGTH=832 /DNA_ID=CAMNT_0038918139 /DNA_START=103 /DNA_END=2598 /DNA_ORIENTATION=-